jgi:uncharacterized Fe-S cluster-containing radical SAM superfamily protein
MGNPITKLLKGIRRRWHADILIHELMRCRGNLPTPIPTDTHQRVLSGINLKTHVCRYAFEYIEIPCDGSTTPCCNDWNRGSIFGNIYTTKDFAKIWNGDIAREFRKSCWDETYKYCDLNICFPIFVEKKNIKNKYNIKTGKMKTSPRYVKFCHDASCNVQCITCRTKHFINSNEETERLNAHIKSTFLPLVRDAEIVELNGSGEVFASKHGRKLITEIANKYKNINFAVHSNGILCNEKNCVELFCNLDRLKVARISIHAATEETYNKIVKGGNFKLVMQNIRWLSELKKQGKIDDISLSFVVQSLNYHEMKQFLELAIELEAVASFWEYRPWGASIDTNYNDYAVWLPSHPNYRDLAKMLEDPLFSSSHYNMSGIIKNVRIE